MDEESQNDELTVLESIFDKNVLKIERIGEPSGSIVVHPVLPDKYYVRYQVKNNENTNSLKYMEFEVKHLPPITLYFVLPRTYPSQVNPAFLLSSHWLTIEQVSLLCRKLDELWREGEKEVILYKWIEFLKEETLSFLKINDYLDISHISDKKFEQNKLCKTSRQPKVVQNSDCKAGSSSRHSDYKRQNGFHQKMHKNVYSDQKFKKFDNQDFEYQKKPYGSKMKGAHKENFLTNSCNGINRTNISRYQDAGESNYRTDQRNKHFTRKDYYDNFRKKNVKNQVCDHLCTEQKCEERFNPTANKRTYSNQIVNGKDHRQSQNYEKVNLPPFVNKPATSRNNSSQSWHTELDQNCPRGSTITMRMRRDDRERKKCQDKLKTKWDIKLNSRILTPMLHGGNLEIDLRAVSEIENKTALITYLTEYSKEKEAEMYSNEWFTCGVCFFEKQGKDFMNFFGCNHKYCKLCMKSYFEIQIQDGNVKSLSCPKENCISQATQYQVRELVSPEVFNRYDRLLLNSILECMADMVYCPRLFCQLPVILEADCSMGICPTCEFVFCTYCRMVYHGVASCKFKSEERKRIREEYLQADKETKTRMECRYGKHTLQQLVEEGLSEEWMESNSKKCPNCNASIEKIDGCNKMTCWKCKAYFCWICMQVLKQVNPYEHFSNPNTPCFNQLFQGVEEFEDSDDEDWEVGAFLL